MHRATPSYVLVYRSLDHKGFRTICDIAQRRELSPRYRPFVPGSGFGEDVRAFAGATIALQERRHTADYDPTDQFRTAHAKLVIEIARTALRHWDAAPRPERHALLMLSLFQPR